MAVTFPFEDAGKNFFGKILRPVAKVSFQSPSKQTWTHAWMIIDTGADFSILPKYLSEDLHISLKKDCIKDTTAGVGGESKIYLCKKPIKVKLGNIEKEVPIAFFNNNEVPALLGRLGFLETFDVEFTKKHKVIFR